MVVSVKSSSMVLPAGKTPATILPLSECDQSKVWSLTPVVYIYKPLDSSMDVHETLKNSLSQALVHFYPLAGRLRWIEGARFEVDCNAMGAKYFEAESDTKLDDLGDFSPSEKMEQLFPKIDYCSFDKLPLFQVQVTKFCCGGLTIATAMCHSIADGLAATQFVSSWARLARKEDINVVPFHDRTVLKPSEPLIPPRFAHEEFKPWPLLLGQTDNTEERNKKTKSFVLELSKSQIDKLKEIANESMTTNDRPYSQFEAISGHLWRCMCKARTGHDYYQPTILRTIGDFRRRLKQPLPKGYFGNASFPLVTQPFFSADLSTKPLSYAAQILRETVAEFTDEYVKSTLDFIKSQEDVSRLRTSFHMQGTNKGPFLGNPNISVTSWINMPDYDVDFGWGKPMHITVAALTSDGKVIIMPTPKGDGSHSLIVSLQLEHTNSFKKFFYQDLGDCRHVEIAFQDAL